MAAIEARGSGFRIAALRNGAKAFTNREYVWLNVPSELNNWRWPMIEGNTPPTLRLRVIRTGIVYLGTGDGWFLQDRGSFIEGWKRTKYSLRYGTSRGTYGTYWIFEKEMKAGETLDVPQHHRFTGTLVFVPVN